jgi:hypothetical protein
VGAGAEGGGDERGAARTRGGEGMSKKRRRLPPMDEKRFWDLIACSAAPTADEQDVAMDKLLRRLPADDLLAFQLRYDDLMHRAYKTDLRGAAYLILGGCSDDGFIDFRAWLVARGKQVYEAALANPDTLADLVSTDTRECNSALNSAAFGAWEAATGRPPDEFNEELSRVSPHWKDPDEGEDWDFVDDDEVLRRFPRLARIFLGEPKD